MKRKPILLFSLLILTGLITACAKEASAAEKLPIESETAGSSFYGEVTDDTGDIGMTYPDLTGEIVISEVMPKNKTTLVYDCLNDWVELLNLSAEPVALDGWRLKCDGSADLSGSVLYPGEYLLIFADEDFSIKDGSSLRLIDPKGKIISEAVIPELENNVSFQLDDKGEYSVSLYPSPGFENSREGYCDYQDTLLPEGELVISEAVVYNPSTTVKQGAAPALTDWVEIKNISGEKVDISDYCLSDNVSELDKYSFPGKELKPGEYITVPCIGKDEAEKTAAKNVAPFSLDSENDTIILSKNGEIEDCISLKDIPYSCSIGRMDGEAGFFYFETPSYGKKNSNGCRYVTECPSASIPGGQHSGSESLLVELEGPGTIYYTLDSSEPGFKSQVYSGPVEINRSTVLRAFACEEGQLRSRSVTYNYLLDTEHTLPIVCINSNDKKLMSRTYAQGDKSIEIPGNISYYYGTEGFSENCSISMNGDTSLFLPKKSMIVRFGGAYGCSMLKYPLFDEGVNEFNALVFRVGQDRCNAVIRNELCQTMAREFSNDLLTQRGRWCAVYLNGAYYGVYALKDNDNRYLYANRYGVSKNSVLIESGYVPPGSDLYPAFDYILKHEMSDGSNYSRACEMMDMNSLADWIIAVGYSGHPDVINGNYKFAASSEDDKKIRLIYYDLDTSLQRPEYPFINIFAPSSDTQMFWLCNSLFKSSEFRTLVLQRTSDALHGAFSDENALAIIDKMADEIDSEMVRDAARWPGMGISYSGWQGNVDRLRKLMSGYHVNVINNLKHFMRLTDEEVILYFGDLN